MALILVTLEEAGRLSDEQRRTKYDIYADIIEIIARKGLCSLTRISYGANMPVDRTKKELNFLLSHGFVNEIATEDSKKYRATRWGLEYLEAYKRIRKFFAALER
jgi:predicted transcriptional regulator